MADTLKVHLDKTTGTGEEVHINGVNTVDYTVISIYFCNTTSGDLTFDLYVDDGGGGTDYYIYDDQSLPAKATFEHTGKIVVADEDHLCMAGSGSGIDVVVSYLEQTA